MAAARQKPIYAFIDSQNLNLAIRSLGWKLDFARFRVYLNDKFKIAKAYLFIGFIKGNEKLYDYLEKSGYILIFKPVINDNLGHAKGNIDAELVLHSMIQYPNYSKAAIISGDGDFFCLAEHLKQKRKLAKIIVPNRKKYSQLYRKFKDDLYFLNNLKAKLASSEKIKRGRRRRHQHR